MSFLSAIGHALGDVAKDVEHGIEGAAKGFLSGGPLGALEGGASGALDEFGAQGGLAGMLGGQRNTSANSATAPTLDSLLQQAEADISQVESLIGGGGGTALGTPIGDNSGLGSPYPLQNLIPDSSLANPFQNATSASDQGGAPVPFTPTQTNQKAQLIADAQFIAQNSSNPAEASQVAQARNDIQYRESNIISNASLISHSDVPASVLQGAMNQIVSDASSGNEANLVGDLNQLSSDIRSGQTPAGQQIYSA